MAKHHFSRSSTAKEQPPVSIGDMEGYHFSVSEHEITENITRKLRENLNVPGVILLNQDKLTGMIPRRTMFERLGRRYGIELFLQKEISILHNELKIEEPLILKNNLRIEKALRKALGRSSQTIYDPIVVEKYGKYSLLDMQTLIMAQTQILSNLNSTMKTLSEFEDIVEEEEPDTATDIIIDALRGVVPFHHINIFVLGKRPPIISNLNPYMDFFDKDIEEFSLHKLPFSFNQTICMDDPQGIPQWQNVTSNPKETPRAWMSIPLVENKQKLGVISIYRYVHTPYTSNEKELATTFANSLSKALVRLLNEDHYQFPTSASNFPRKQKHP